MKGYVAVGAENSPYRAAPVRMRAKLDNCVPSALPRPAQHEGLERVELLGRVGRDAARIGGRPRGQHGGAPADVLGAEDARSA
eukprot:6944015-Prymnesium_polylepis.1